MALGSGLMGMSNAPGRRKKEEDEILAMGMGPRRAMPEEKEYIKPSTFKDADIQIVSSQPDKAAAMHTKNRIERGEQGLREREFQYDLESDPLWQQYISSARRNGQNAMTDTVAKVASQTGGIAGSYAVSAGAGAYNDYMQSANDVIPELEQLAYRKYQDDLARDREIYEMDEAKRIEDAQYNATMHGHQNYGRPLTDEEKMLIYANKGYVTPDGDVIDRSGNLIKKGTKYDEEIKQTAYNDYEQNGPYGMSPNNFKEMQKYYKWDDVAGMFFNWDGTPLRYGGSTPEEMILTNYMGGIALSPDDIRYMINRGYDYNEGKLYLDGQEINKAFVRDAGISNDLLTGIPLLDFVSAANPEEKVGNPEEKAKDPKEEVVDDPEKEVKAPEENTDPSKKINPYIISFTNSKSMGVYDNPFYKGYVYDNALGLEENAYLFVQTLQEPEEVKMAVYNELVKGR